MNPHHITTKSGTCGTGPCGILPAFILLAAILFCCAAPLSASETGVENAEDAAITSLVKQSLLFHLLLNSKTDTSNGMVTLSGRADNLAEKELGTSLASAIPGVKRVVNHMVIPGTLAGNGR